LEKSKKGFFREIFFLHIAGPISPNVPKSPKKPTQFHDFKINSCQCPYRRKSQYRRNCVGVWSFNYKLLLVRHKWRYIKFRQIKFKNELLQKNLKKNKVSFSLKKVYIIFYGVSLIVWKLYRLKTLLFCKVQTSNSYMYM
jgi:hypothetical protein